MEIHFFTYLLCFFGTNDVKLEALPIITLAFSRIIEIIPYDTIQTGKKEIIAYSHNACEF